VKGRTVKAVAIRFGPFDSSTVRLFDLSPARQK